MSDLEYEEDTGPMRMPPKSSRLMYISFTPIGEREAAAFAAGAVSMQARAAGVCRDLASSFESEPGSAWVLAGGPETTAGEAAHTCATEIAALSLEPGAVDALAAHAPTAAEPTDTKGDNHVAD